MRVPQGPGLPPRTGYAAVRGRRRACRRERGAANQRKVLGEVDHLAHALTLWS